MGDFVEVEGESELIGSVARSLGLDPSDAVPGSYMSLWSEFRARHPEMDLPPDMVFTSMTTVAAAMVLAAGRGERMRPLSDVLPKPALPLTDGPVVASALKLAAAAGVDRLVVNTWHLRRLMENAVVTATGPGMTVAISPEDALMGTAGGLALARDRGLLGTAGPVLVVNGDGILRLDLGPLFEHHRARRDAVTLGLLPHPDPGRWSRVVVDHKGRVAAIRPRGKAVSGETSFVYPGVMVVSREALDGLPSSPGETPDRLWFPALDTGRLGGALVAGEWREVGTAADYLAVVSEQLAGRNVIHPTAAVASTAVINASLIGRNAIIGDRAVIHGSVVAEGASVAADSVVTTSVFLGSSRSVVGEKVVTEVRVAPIATA